MSMAAIGSCRCVSCCWAPRTPTRSSRTRRRTRSARCSKVSQVSCRPRSSCRSSSFAPDKFDLKASAAAFKGDSEDDRKKLLYLVAAVNEADDEIDFAEDDYLRALAQGARPAEGGARRSDRRDRDRRAQGNVQGGPQGSAAAADAEVEVRRYRYGLTRASAIVLDGSGRAAQNAAPTRRSVMSLLEQNRVVIG